MYTMSKKVLYRVDDRKKCEKQTNASERHGEQTNKIRFDYIYFLSFVFFPNELIISVNAPIQCNECFDKNKQIPKKNWKKIKKNSFSINTVLSRFASSLRYWLFRRFFIFLYVINAKYIIVKLKVRRHCKHKKRIEEREFDYIKT